MDYCFCCRLGYHRILMDSMTDSMDNLTDSMDNLMDSMDNLGATDSTGSSMELMDMKAVRSHRYSHYYRNLLKTARPVVLKLECEDTNCHHCYLYRHTVFVNWYLCLDSRAMVMKVYQLLVNKNNEQRT